MTDPALIPLPSHYGNIRAYALVDVADLPALAAFNWHLNGQGYAGRDEAIGVNKRRRVLMHRQLLGLEHKDPRQSDHINGNRLDNRRSNLRIVTHAENAQNMRGGYGRSGHRNVHWHKESSRWRVLVKVGGKSVVGGYFVDLDEAVRAARQLRSEILPFAVDVDLDVLATPDRAEVSA